MAHASWANRSSGSFSVIMRAPNEDPRERDSRALSPPGLRRLLLHGEGARCAPLQGRLVRRATCGHPGHQATDRVRLHPDRRDARGRDVAGLDRHLRPARSAPPRSPPVPDDAGPARRGPPGRALHGRDRAAARHALPLGRARGRADHADALHRDDRKRGVRQGGRGPDGRCPPRDRRERRERSRDRSPHARAARRAVGPLRGAPVPARRPRLVRRLRLHGSVLRPLLHRHSLPPADARDRLPRGRLDRALQLPQRGPAGEWLADDALAPTFRDVLQGMAKNTVPYLLAATDAYEAWARAAEPGARPPRSLGKVQVPGRTSPSSAWCRATRPGWCSAPSTSTARSTTTREPESTPRLDGTGWEPLLARPLEHRIGKDGFDLVVPRRPA